MSPAAAGLAMWIASVLLVAGVILMGLGYPLTSCWLALFGALLVSPVLADAERGEG